MHDGSVVSFRDVDAGYDPTDRDAAYAHVRRLQELVDKTAGPREHAAMEYVRRYVAARA